MVRVDAKRPKTPVSAIESSYFERPRGSTTGDNGIMFHHHKTANTELDKYTPTVWLVIA
jgi:hypothetical protein